MRSLSSYACYHEISKKRFFPEKMRMVMRNSLFYASLHCAHKNQKHIWSIANALWCISHQRAVVLQSSIFYDAVILRPDSVVRLRDRGGLRSARTACTHAYTCCQDTLLRELSLKKCLFITVVRCILSHPLNNDRSTCAPSVGSPGLRHSSNTSQSCDRPARIASDEDPPVENGAWFSGAMFESP